MRNSALSKKVKKRAGECELGTKSAQDVSPAKTTENKLNHRQKCLGWIIPSAVNATNIFTLDTQGVK